MHPTNRRRSPASNLLSTILAAILAAANASASEMYRFAIDRDGLVGAPACKLNSPIGPQDRIHVRDGHFYTVGDAIDSKNVCSHATISTSKAQ